MTLLSASRAWNSRPGGSSAQSNTGLKVWIEPIRIYVSTAIIDPGSPVRSRRDSAFRAEVLFAWEHRCAFCGFNVQLDNSDIALDYAHIRWCQFGGPDSINNGLACCSIHHQAFDRGAISISSDQRILISSRVYGNGGLDSLFVALSGTPLRKPNRKSAAPKRDFLDWHRTQVFRGQARS